jgi:Predicted phosphotransferase related to Ser/Thr protein kinases
MQFRLQKIKSDASFREFFRLHKGKKTSIIVTANKERFKNLIAYSYINKFFIKKGIYTPKTISQHFNEGLIEIEDLGNKTLSDFVKKSKNSLNLYKKCINLIIKIQKIKPIKKIKISSKKYLNLGNYNIRNLHKESDLFLDWYLPGVSGKKKSQKFKRKIKKELNKLYKKIYFKNRFIVHRDFHVSNIIPSGKKLAIIDTQDTILGNPMYDVASLIDDVRIKIPLKIKNKIFKYYLQKCVFGKKEMHLLKNDFDILSVQRNLKILGIFYRLNERDRKPGYLKYYLIHGVLLN